MSDVARRPIASLYGRGPLGNDALAQATEHPTPATPLGLIVEFVAAVDHSAQPSHAGLEYVLLERVRGRTYPTGEGPHYDIEMRGIGFDPVHSNHRRK